MENIFKVTNALIPIIVVVIGFMLQDTGYKKLMLKKVYKEHDEIETMTIIKNWIITMIISLFINYCIYVLLKSIFCNVIKTIYVIESILIIISFIICSILTKIITRVYTNRINKCKCITQREYYKVKRSRLVRLVFIFQVSAFIIVGIFAIQKANDLDIIVGCCNLFGSLFMLKIIMTPIDSVSYIFEVITLIEVYLKDDEIINCDDIFEKKDFYLLKRFNENQGAKQCDYVKVSKERVNKIDIKTLSYNVKENVNKNE